MNWTRFTGGYFVQVMQRATSNATPAEFKAIATIVI